ncbi:hypothetical protein [Rhizobium sp. 007]|nr:hypothetical protein [Rhizobium sp. 007]
MGRTLIIVLAFSLMPLAGCQTVGGKGKGCRRYQGANSRRR